MVPWVFTLICCRHPGVIHWYTANAAWLSVEAGCWVLHAEGEPCRRLLLGDSAPPLGLSFLLCKELRLGHL